jgi:sterol desaturase/sphingolipid hydroxylase (fatty acid hydroxylase superfamily)
VIPLVLAALGGAVGWSFLEYVIHRWLGHDKRYVRNVFGREHTRHHAVGHYFAAGWKKGLAAVVVVALTSGPAIALGGVATGLAAVGGFVGFYLTYELVHRLLHVREGVGPYARWARAHHFHHHFHDPASNFGVTSPVWDVVFGTRVVPGRIRVPEKLAMSWLIDPVTGDVRAHLADRWELRRPRREGVAG